MKACGPLETAKSPWLRALMLVELAPGTSTVVKMPSNRSLHLVSTDLPKLGKRIFRQGELSCREIFPQMVG